MIILTGYVIKSKRDELYFTMNCLDDWCFDANRRLVHIFPDREVAIECINNLELTDIEIIPVRFTYSFEITNDMA